MTYSIEQYFNQKALLFGPTHKAVGWSSKERQYARFSRIYDAIQDVSGTVLDVGCGVGDFYHFLLEKQRFASVVSKSQGLKFEYTGIDISGEMVSLATSAYPGGNFLKKRLEDMGEEPYDVVLACGTFNMHQGGSHDLYLKQSIQWLLSLTKQHCCVSLLTDRCVPKHDMFYYANAEIVCSWIPPGWDIVVDDLYLDNDLFLSFKRT